MTLKTQPSNASVKAFVDRIEDDIRRKEVRAVMKVLRRVTGETPRIWGDAIIGYGSYHYRYASGQEGDWFLTGVSPRKQNLTVYVMAGFTPHAELMRGLGRHKTGKSCLYIKRLADIDIVVLEELIRTSLTHLRQILAGRSRPA